MKILIDTNIFLDFYRSDGASVKIFSTLMEHIDKFILTDQIIQEFDRNREGVIKKVKENFQLESKLIKITSSYLKNRDEFKELIEIQKQYEAKQKEISLNIDEIIKNPSLDPIANYFNEFVNESLNKGSVYYTTDEIIKRAEKRKKIGNPPTSDKYSLGDEINWEIVLENVKENIILVGRDNTYTNNLTFLQKDFHKRTGYIITDLTKTITSALNIAGINTTAELVKEENKVVEDIEHYNEFWKHKPNIE
jgi:predicted nucleic acid-binding protein